MKKGCLVVLVILIVLGIAGFFVVKSVINKAVAMIEGFQELAMVIDDNSDRLNAAYPFDEPENLTLAAEQTNSYFAVRKQLNDVISDTEFFKSMKKFEEIEDTNQEPSFSDFSDLVSNVLPSCKSIANNFFSFLEARKFSPAEYYYVSNIVVAMISSELEKGNFKDEVEADFSRKIRKLMLEAEESGAPAFQVKTRLRNLEPGEYNAILDIVKVHVADFNQIQNSFYFDAFTSQMDSETSFEFDDEEAYQEMKR